MSARRPQEPLDFDLAASADGDILVITFSGRSTERNVQAMTARYFEILRSSGKQTVLADIRLLQGRLSAAETHLLVHELPAGEIPANFKTAILESEARRAYADFLETVLVNAGVPVRCMVDRAEALAWPRAE